MSVLIVSSLEKHKNDEIQAACVLLFDEEGREHQVWYERTATGYELQEHKAPTKQISDDDINIYENIRNNADQFIEERGYFTDNSDEDPDDEDSYDGYALSHWKSS